MSVRLSEQVNVDLREHGGRGGVRDAEHALGAGGVPHLQGLEAQEGDASGRVQGGAEEGHVGHG